MDDSKLIRKLLTEILESKGYTCSAVNNFSKAKEELNKCKPKLIFLDVNLSDSNLPDSNGYEFCRSIKSTKKFKNILIYYFTGVSESEIGIKALETRADGYLKKPFDIADFDDILQHLD
ncbi:MAG: response regulator [Candidatus Lokiarchaeia archaeon]